MYFRDGIVVDLYSEFTDATPIKDLKILCSINQKISPITVICSVVLLFLQKNVLKSPAFEKKKTKEKPFQTTTDHFYSFKEKNLTYFYSFFLCFFSKCGGEGCLFL